MKDMSILRGQMLLVILWLLKNNYQSGKKLIELS